MFYNGLQIGEEAETRTKFETINLILMKNILMKLKRLFCLCAVSGSCSPKVESKPDEYNVIMAGNIMVAQGYECSKCKLIRPYNVASCNCH